MSTLKRKTSTGWEEVTPSNPFQVPVEIVGGTQLPNLANPGTAADIAEGKQLIDNNGNVITGSVITVESTDEEEIFYQPDGAQAWKNGEYMGVNYTLTEDILFRNGATLGVKTDASKFGNATPADVLEGKVFVSQEGWGQVGTYKPSTNNEGFVIKSGTTTSGTINTGLSDIEQFFIYKESQTATGLIHLHYTKTATSRLYASAWSTSSWGSKTITNGTGGVSVNGGSITISARQATQGALSNNTTYKWIAIGTE